MKTGLKKQLETLSGGAVLFQEPLARWTSFKLGGPADALAMPPHAASLAGILSLLKAESIPCFVMGKGTNLVVREGGFRGVIISLKKGFNSICRPEKAGRTVMLTVEGGVFLPRVLKYSSSTGLSGLEFASGIPGSLGGAIAMNAGSWGGEIKDSLFSASIMDAAGTVRNWRRDELTFGYRSLLLPEGSIILSGTFSLEEKEPDTVKSLIRLNLERKRHSQPLRFPSAGSIFKNPEGSSAGQLIDQAGLKGTCCGKAMVSKKHANFILNTGEATAQDVLDLIEKIRGRIKEQFGICLDTEVEVIGEKL